MTQQQAGPTDRSPYREAVGTLDVGAVRAWALAHGIAVSRTGGMPRFVFDLYREAQAEE